MSLRICRNIWRLNQRRLYLTKAVEYSAPGFSKPPQILANPVFSEIRGVSAKFSTKAALTSKTEDVGAMLDKLRSSQTATGAVNYELLTKTVSSLNGDLSEEQGVYLLECCAKYLPTQSKKIRLGVFHKIWNYLKENNLISEQHYFAALRVFRANKATLTDFREFLEEVKELNNPKIYEELVWLCCGTGNITQAREILDEMRSKKMPLTQNVFNALILGHSRGKDLEGLKGVLEAMSAAGVERGTDTHCELARAYIENGELKKFEEILSEWGSSFDTSQLLGILKSAALIGSKSAVNQSVKLLPADFLSMKEVPVAIRNICTELVYSGLADNALSIIEAFPKPVFSENQDTDTFGVAFIRDVIRSNQPANKVVEYCKVLVNTEKNARALHVACEFALRWNSRDALKFLEALAEMEPLRPHYFWPLLLSAFRSDGEAGMLRILKSMSALKTECDYETMASYVLPRLSVTLENEMDAIKVLENCGLEASEFLTPLISHMIFTQKVDAATSICELYQAKLDTENLVYPIVNLIVVTKTARKYKKLAKLVGVLSRKSRKLDYDFVGQLLLDIVSNQKLRDEVELWRKLIPELKAQNLHISFAAGDIVCSHLTRFEENADVQKLAKTVREMVNKKLNIPEGEFIGLHISHPRDMNLDELECHLVELQSKGMNTRGVLRRLLQLCVREGKLDRALEVKKQCDQLKVQVSPGMMASVFDMYTKLKQIENAEAYYQKIKRTFPGFLLDEHKIIDFAALLVESGRYNDATELLKNRAKTNKVIGGDYVNKNLWNLLTSCANSPSCNSRTKELFLLLTELKFCRPKNIFLGPIIRAHLLRKDIKAAVAEYKDFTEKYRKTPLQFELMSQLVALSNDEDMENFQISSSEAQELLQQVISASAKVHGASNSNSTLVLAVADSGTDSQLRKLLINPEIRLNSEALIKNCEHLSGSGKIDILLKLAKAGRGMGHVVREQDLYNLLLGNFAKENNCTAALELFEKLEADDESKISQDFVRSLVNLFRMNNFEIPTSVALRVRSVL